MIERPKITPELFSEFTKKAPSRLIRKLDKAPERAEAWEWKKGDGEDSIVIQTNSDAVVRLKGALLSREEDASCDCLLAPKCLHLLSVISRLELADPEEREAPASEEVEEPPQMDDIVPSVEQKQAASVMIEVVSGILGGGIESASIVAQGRLLSALHQARIVGLHRASASATRAIKRIRSIREGKSEKLTVLRADLIDILDSCETLLKQERVSIGDIGVGRRVYYDAGSLKLHGVVTEAIGGDGGYGGCVTYLLDEEGMFSTLSTVHPQEMGGAKQAWKTAVSVGDIVASHEELCRKQVFVQNATRSADGRLGAGKKVKAVIGKDVSFESGPISAWFSTSIIDQIEQIFSRSKIPVLVRPPGWDFLAFEAKVAGVCDGGVALLTEDERLIIASSDRDWKGNMSRLGEMVGSTFRFIGRVHRDAFLKVSLLTIFHSEDSEAEAKTAWTSVQLGLEHFQIERARVPNSRFVVTEIPKVWDAFDRVLERAMLGGWRTFPPQSIQQINMTKKRMKRAGMLNATRFLEALYHSAQKKEGNGRNVGEFTRAWVAAISYRHAFLEALVKDSWSIHAKPV